ncbi:(Trans)glycosidase [Glarea lozoyensis ATCC 20868]|uniref:Probable beta-glucosidase G n=1 Tax=Glarea lozoyensis (strain ATCC 20868 / MF5171) TaxID=1116229 RepID=S3D3K2_GLAL2|nr:(Trans)glycosidase [Glarea lozoyensis ATCC 20868]EPE32345.1 (Trans)glycosidase [Glarea lozoyensis ATCC 20868]
MHLLNSILSLALSELVVVAGHVQPQDANTITSRIPKSANEWATAIAKADAFLAQLNLTEKVVVVTGASGSCIGNVAAIPRLNFSGICMSDGPTSINRQDLITVFPAGLRAAATWDKDLIYQRGYALGAEFRAKGSHVGLGPTAGPLGRNPLGSRNWEGFSTDPYLTGKAMYQTVLGMQDAGIQTSSKHFIGNEQETQRSNSFLEDGTEIMAYSANIDDRTLHELYLWPFADAVRAGTTSVMCSYNRLNQTYACENDGLLNKILKEELGFQGYVVSDWFATHSGVDSINGGLDLTMPGSPTQELIGTGTSYFGKNLTLAVNNGSVTMDRVDDMVRRVMTPYYLLGQDSVKYPTLDPSTLCVLGAHYSQQSCNTPARDVREDHASLVRKIGADGTVLLKNTNNALPLKSPKNIAVFGNDAGDFTDGLTYVDGTEFIQGTLATGGGSGSARFTYIVSPLEAIKARAHQTGARVQYILSNDLIARGDFHSIFPSPDVCIVFIKTYASEGSDRVDFEHDHNSTLVVNNVAKRCPNTVVVSHSGGINTMPWAKNPNVTAILAAHYPGEQSGNSIVDILYGDINPSGKLPYTIPEHADDCNIPITNLTNNTDPNGWQIDFNEGLFIDYRHFDAHNLTPLYEFGHGLSYTTFNLTTLTPTNLTDASALSPTPDATRKVEPGGNPDLYTPLLCLTTTLTNTGSLAGAQVVQLYLSFPQTSTPEGTPRRVLRGFEKMFLEPGTSARMYFELQRRDVSFWDVNAQTWRIPEGEFGVSVGFSLGGVRAKGVFSLL